MTKIWRNVIECSGILNYNIYAVNDFSYVLKYTEENTEYFLR